jgi:hypothetical protein
MDPEDWPELATICAADTATGNATFERNPSSWEAWNAKPPT